MRLRVYQVLLIASAIAFLLGKPAIGIVLLFFGVGTMMFDFIPGRNKEEGEEKEIIKPLD